MRADARGTLIFAQEGDQIPFSIKRIFSIYDVAPGGRRGGHAHRKQHQFLHMATGTVSINVYDGRTKDSIILNKPSLALYVPPMHWLDLGDFTAGAVCTVLVSGPYLEADYIRNLAEFQAICDTADRGEG